MNKFNPITPLMMAWLTMCLVSCGDSDVDNHQPQKEIQSIASTVEGTTVPTAIGLIQSDTGFIPVVSTISFEALLECLGDDSWSLGRSEYHVYEDGRLSEPWERLTPIASEINLIDDSTIGWTWSGIGPHGELTYGKEEYPFEYDEGNNLLSFFNRRFTIISITENEIHCTSSLGTEDSELMRYNDVKPYVLKYCIFSRIRNH